MLSSCVVLEDRSSLHEAYHTLSSRLVHDLCGLIYRPGSYSLLIFHSCPVTLDGGFGSGQFKSCSMNTSCFFGLYWA